MKLLFNDKVVSKVLSKKPCCPDWPEARAG